MEQLIIEVAPATASMTWDKITAIQLSIVAAETVARLCSNCSLRGEGNKSALVGVIRDCNIVGKVATDLEKSAVGIGWRIRDALRSFADAVPSKRAISARTAIRDEAFPAAAQK